VSQLSKREDSPASLDSMIRHAEERIRDYVAQVRGGNFPVRPNGDAVCQSCDYDVMCRVQSLRAAEDEQDRND
ncbi:MAG TPA: PD-(D/E)XK nuclease family protein, partial [Blastocatellia bacterium]|nr:PD-(D/E)XK nuclease family protein [Blastocatellia bacterium]